MPVVPADPTSSYRKVQRDYDRRLARALQRAARDIEAMIVSMGGTGIGAQVRRAQLTSTLRAIRTQYTELWGTDVLGLTQSGREAAAKAAQDAVETMNNVLFRALPEAVAETLSDGLALTARAGIEADMARVPRRLSSLVYKNYNATADVIEQTIRSGIISGLSAKELARSVYSYISPTTPGGASYAAMRLARTEINAAFHNQQIKAADQVGVTGVKWNLSGSHKRPDVCNELSGRDSHKMGAGVFPAKDVPGKPHPHCFCYLSYVTMTPKQFSDALARGDFDSELDRRTKANLARLQTSTPPVAKKTVKKTTTKKTTPPKPKTFAERWKTGEKSSVPLGGGSMSKTSVVTLNDGSKAVVKKDLGYGGDPKDAQDAEELAALLGRRVGFRTPDVVRLSDDTVAMEYIDGKTPYDLFGPTEDNAEMLAFVRSVDGRRMALFDAAIVNTDRNLGNLVFDSRRRVYGLDHGGAFSSADYIDMDEAFRTLGATSATGRAMFGTNGSYDYTVEDVDFLLAAVRGMRSDFARVRKLKWYNQTIARLSRLRRLARGTERLFS